MRQQHCYKSIATIFFSSHFSNFIVTIFFPFHFGNFIATNQLPQFFFYNFRPKLLLNLSPHFRQLYCLKLLLNFSPTFRQFGCHNSPFFFSSHFRQLGCHNWFPFSHSSSGTSPGSWTANSSSKNSGNEIIKIQILPSHHLSFLSHTFC